jgi:hypothetical protein
MNIGLKVVWNNPVGVNDTVSQSTTIVNIPFGAMILDPNVASPVTSVNTQTGAVVLTAIDVGATTQAYVDQQDDALETIINTKASSASVTQSLSTKADLVDGVIPANQLPSFVDDVLEYDTLTSLPFVGEAAKIYITIDTNKTYRWTGSSYAEIGSGGVALGETALTAYRGDRGKEAYDHSLSQGNPHNTTTSEINEGTKLFFTEPRVRNTVLTGLVTNDSTNVTNTDTVEVAIGKLQAKSQSAGGTVNWVDVSTLTGYVKHVNVSAANSRIQVAVIDGLLWMRGYLTLTSSVTSNVTLFSYTASAYLWDNTYLGSTADNAFTYSTTINKSLKLQELADFKVIAKQEGNGTSGNITNRLSIVADTGINSAINFALLEPVCLGIAKNP